MTNPTPAEAPLVLAIDIGTSSLRAALYDRAARLVPGSRVQLANLVQTTPDGGVELDPLLLLRNVEQTVDQVLARAGAQVSEIVAVGFDTFWHSLLGVDANGNPLTPLYTWADTRAKGMAAELRRELDEDAVLQRTGCMLHPSYFPAKLRWLATTEPDYARVTRWVSFGEFFYLQLFGAATVSYSTASGTGLLDRASLQWDAEMLRASGIAASQLSPLSDLTPASGLRPHYARRWPGLAALPWLPAVGDGAANNLGIGATSPDEMALMIGTSGAMRVVCQPQRVPLPHGLWNYYLDGKRTIYGGALSEGGGVVAWLWNNLKLSQMNLAESEAAVATMQPDAHGLTILPFFAGERSPGYAGEARASIIGLSLNSSSLDLLRATLEAIAYRFASVHALLAGIVPAAGKIIASGGALRQSPVWAQIIADVIGSPLQLSAIDEGSERGAAILALEAVGALQVGVAEGETTVSYQPNANNYAAYHAAMARQQDLYAKLVKE